MLCRAADCIALDSSGACRTWVGGYQLLLQGLEHPEPDVTWYVLCTGQYSGRPDRHQGGVTGMTYVMPLEAPADSRASKRWMVCSYKNHLKTHALAQRQTSPNLADSALRQHLGPSMQLSFVSQHHT
eukprot:scaffold58341_cov24-Tisochrysis_lutea.AAC.1